MQLVNHKHAQVTGKRVYLRLFWAFSTGVRPCLTIKKNVHSINTMTDHVKKTLWILHGFGAPTLASSLTTSSTKMARTTTDHAVPGLPNWRQRSTNLANGLIRTWINSKRSYNKSANGRQTSKQHSHLSPKSKPASNAALKWWRTTSGKQSAMRWPRRLSKFMISHISWSSIQHTYKRLCPNTS